MTNTNLIDDILFNAKQKKKVITFSIDTIFRLYFKQNA